MKDEVFMTLAWSLPKLHTDSWYDKWIHKIAYINSVRSQKGVLCSTGDMNNKRADRQLKYRDLFGHLALSLHSLHLTLWSNRLTVS